MSGKTGLWLIGCQGGVSTTVAVGVSALRKGAMPNTGLVSAKSEFAGLEFVDWSNVVIGGHEIRDISSVDAARELVETSRAIPAHLFEVAKTDLEQIDADTRPGVVLNAGSIIKSLASEKRCIPCATVNDAIKTLQGHWDEFKSAHGLDQIIVVNLSSTEPPLKSDVPDSWEAVSATFDQADSCLGPSSILSLIHI